MIPIDGTKISLLPNLASLSDADLLVFVHAGITYKSTLATLKSALPSAYPAQWGSILTGTGVDSQTDLVTYLTANFEQLINKGVANGYVPLNSSTLIDSVYLPSYVDDIIEVANYASLPVTGETGKIYITLDTNKQYRWSGSTYIAITNGFISTSDDVPEGTTNLYFTAARSALYIPYTGATTNVDLNAKQLNNAISLAYTSGGIAYSLNKDRILFTSTGLDYSAQTNLGLEITDTTNNNTTVFRRNGVNIVDVGTPANNAFFNLPIGAKTGAQTFAMISDLSSYLPVVITSPAIGEVIKFDGTNWVNGTVSGGGGGTVTSVSVVTANGFSGIVANATTTPAITLTLQNATTSQSGQLTSTDWNTFNSKLSSLSGAWLTTGNSGSGLLAGTTSNNSFDVITNNATVLRFNPIASSVDYLQLTSGSASISPKLETLGASADVNLDVSLKGSVSYLNLTKAGESKMRFTNTSNAHHWATGIGGGGIVSNGIFFISYDSATVTLFTLDQSGQVSINGSNAGIGSASTNGFSVKGVNSVKIGIATNASGAITATSGTKKVLSIWDESNNSFQPTSGSANFIWTLFNGTINQSGATGYTRLLDFSTLTYTSVSGVHSQIYSTLANPAGGGGSAFFLNHNTGTAPSKLNGNLNLTGTAKIATYAGNTTVANGVGSILSYFPVTTYTANQTGVSLLASVPATGDYRVTVYTNSSNPAGMTNVTINYTSGGTPTTQDKYNAFTIGFKATEVYLLSNVTNGTAITFDTTITGVNTYDILIYVERLR